MELELSEKPEDNVWTEALSLYHQAFPAQGRKPDAILKRMLDSGISLLATFTESQVMKAMAVCGVLDKPKLLLLDYLTVRETVRGQGTGGAFVARLADWARSQGLRGLLVEAEAEDTPENEARLRFWENCGFVRTDYIHQYIWVPEPYRALILCFESGGSRPPEGQTLFRHISEFHRRSFS